MPVVAGLKTRRYDGERGPEGLAASASLMTRRDDCGRRLKRHAIAGLKARRYDCGLRFEGPAASAGQVSRVARGAVCPERNRGECIGTASWSAATLSCADRAGFAERHTAPRATPFVSLMPGVAGLKARRYDCERGPEGLAARARA